MMNQNYMRLVSSMNITPTTAWENLKSISFDGVDEYCDLGVLSATVSASNLSYSAWIKTPTLSTYQMLFGINNAGGNNRQYAIIQTDGSVQMVISASLAYPLVRTSASDIVINTWYHICVVFDGSLTGNFNRLKIYIDGVSSGVTDSDTVPSATRNNSTNFMLGSRSDLAIFGNINMDEFSLFDYSLSATEVTALYNSGVPTDLMTLAAAKQPEHYYRMGDGDTFPTITDIGATAGNDGTMTNMEAGDIQTDVP